MDWKYCQLNLFSINSEFVKLLQAITATEECPETAVVFQLTENPAAGSTSTAVTCSRTEENIPSS